MADEHHAPASPWECKHIDVVPVAPGYGWCKDCGAFAFHPRAALIPSWADGLHAYAQWFGAAPGTSTLFFIRPRNHGEPPKAFGMRMAAEEEQARYEAHRARTDRETVP